MTSLENETLASEGNRKQRNDPPNLSWNERTARLRRLEADLASIPAGALDASDERERDRLHSWVLAQQRFFVTLQEAVKARGTEEASREERLLPEEREVLRETDRFVDQTQACLTQGRVRAGL